MAEKKELEPIDDDAAAAADELRRKKRRKCIIFNIASFVISNILINAILALTILKPRTPSFRIQEATVAAFHAGAPANASLSATVNATFSVKNTNFGRYDYGNATVVFMHRGTPMGEVHVASAGVTWRSTRKFNLVARLELGNNRLLRGDLRKGIIPITSEGKLSGGIEFMMVMKRRRMANMNCTMEMVRKTLQIRNIICK